MSKHNIIVLIAAAGVLALAGCSKEPEVADGGNITIEASETRDGVIYDVVTDGLRQRFSFTED